MNKYELKLLKMLFYDRGGEFFEVIDEGGIRKPAITTCLSDAQIENGGFNEEIWTVKINWRLIARLLVGEE